MRLVLGEAAISVGCTGTSGESRSAEARLWVGAFQVATTLDRFRRAGAERLFEGVGFEMMLCCRAKRAARTDGFGGRPCGCSW